MPAALPTLLPRVSAAAWLVCCLASGAQEPPSAASAAVGNVTLVLGQAVILEPSGHSRPVAKGADIHPGERVQTAQSGHVHIRFIDGALVSVRPASELAVQDYRYDPQQPSESVVRFRLEQGAARAISGAAAENARERFRLNTPLVAIGVRGTDFVVRTDAHATLASVTQGAIVMAPLGQDCQAQGLGPCDSASAQLLSAADMPDTLLEYQPQFAQPQIRKIQPEQARPEHSEDGIAVASLTKSPAAAAQQFSEGEGSTTSNRAIGSAILQMTVEQLGDGLNAEAQHPQQPTNLAWGRWDIGQGATQSLAQSISQARQDRQVTVGNAKYTLYRTASEPNLLSSSLGRLSFALQGSEAQFISSNGASLPASVNGGSLAIDFTQHSFSTQLDLSSTPTGSLRLQAGGAINQEGIFFDRSQTGQVVAGAVSLDAQNAGYFFEKAAAGGQLTGITLWGRKP